MNIIKIKKLNNEWNRFLNDDNKLNGQSWSEFQHKNEKSVN